MRTATPLVLLAALAAVLLPAQAQEAGVVDDRNFERRLEAAVAKAHEAEPERTLDVFIKAGVDRAFRYTLAEPGEAGLDPVALHERLLASTYAIGVRYKCSSCTRWHLRLATAFAIAREGVVVTNYHVIDKGGATAVVMDASGRASPVIGLLATDPASDLAILRVEATDLSPLPIAPAAPPVGSDVFVLSNPANHFFVYSRGMVSRRSKNRHDAAEQLEITADYARGSSGAAVVDSRGNVIGVVKATRSIYYEEHAHGPSDNLQMVIKMTIPSPALVALARREAE